MKHAYLIIAHHEFQLLEYLIRSLDDIRNDIYIHFDKKVKQLPTLFTQHAKLIILDNRVDVRWGDVSQIKSEFVLFRAAFERNSYGYYHLLSGVDIPLKTQDQIHDFFYRNKGKEFIGFNQEVTESEINKKVRSFHFFPKLFRNSNAVIALLVKCVRSVTVLFQQSVKMYRHCNIEFKKGTSWVSVTHDFVHFLLKKEEETLKIYKNTFCGDEFFLHTLCWNSSFRQALFNLNNEVIGCQRKINWSNGKLYDWEEKDFDVLVTSKVLFARKFNSKDINFVRRMYAAVKNGGSGS